MASSKQCFKCGLKKPMDEFYCHAKMADGRLNKCKACAKLDVRKNRIENIDYYRQYDKKRALIPERAAAAKQISSMWRKSDARITACHSAVARAVRSGALIRKNCERCGEIKTLAHHESYNKKLEVVWLCQPCHKQRHKEMALAGIDPLEI